MNRPKGKPPLLRYSLRTLLGAIALVAISLGVLVERAARQRQAVRQLVQIQATIMYDFQLRPVNGQVVPSPLSKIIGIDLYHSVESVMVYDPEGADCALPFVKRLPRLRTVWYVPGPGANMNTLDRYKKELRHVEIKTISAVVG